jgi:hypothetical protein
MDDNDFHRNALLGLIDDMVKDVYITPKYGKVTTLKEILILISQGKNLRVERPPDGGIKEAIALARKEGYNFVVSLSEGMGLKKGASESDKALFLSLVRVPSLVPIEIADRLLLVTLATTQENPRVVTVARKILSWYDEPFNVDFSDPWVPIQTVEETAMTMDDKDLIKGFSAVVEE